MSRCARPCLRGLIEVQYAHNFYFTAAAENQKIENFPPALGLSEHMLCTTDRA